ncbi:MAG: hypothetical protein SOR61_04900 [Evtepia sp.]|uniref:hypothetical protein n=1 Tax=Evtepia sp. TaxID=2773933 RepID=UPI002A76124D|nr:hypothetical protein [Evtepia sp.]MDY3014518.1 hypothetical protein [Evtepia sp.]
MKKRAGNVVGGGSYISRAVFEKLARRKNMQMGIGGFFMAFYLFGIVMGLVGDDQDLRDGLVSSIVIFALFTLLFVLGARNAKKIGLVNRYNQIFMCDADGTVTMEELARQVGKPPEKVISELEWLFQKGVFCDCTLQKEGRPGVILSGRADSKTSFVNVVCEQCNGTTRLRAGTYGKCEYCGSPISSRKING